MITVVEREQLPGAWLVTLARHHVLEPSESGFQPTVPPVAAHPSSPGDVAGRHAREIIHVVIGRALQLGRTRARLERQFSARDFTEGGRVKLWRAAWQSVGDRPLLGNGLRSERQMSGTSENPYPHNLFLQVWLNGGFPSLHLCIAVLSLPARDVLRRTRRYSDPSPRPMDFYSAWLVFLVGAVWVLAARHPRSA